MLGAFPKVKSGQVSFICAALDHSYSLKGLDRPYSCDTPLPKPSPKGQERSPSPRFFVDASVHQSMYQSWMHASWMRSQHHPLSVSLSPSLSLSLSELSLGCEEGFVMGYKYTSSDSERGRSSIDVFLIQRAIFNNSHCNLGTATSFSLFKTSLTFLEFRI